MKILVVGATGGTGRATVERLLAEGHEVTAFARKPEATFGPAPRLTVARGDATDAAAVGRAVRGHDAVVVALGITENPIRVRLFGPSRTPLDVRSRGTAHVIDAMRAHGVRRLVVLTSYGVGETYGRLRVVDKILFALFLKPQMADTAIQTARVTASGLEWVLVQPVHLTDDADDAAPFVSTEGDTARMGVSRASVARVIADAATKPGFAGKALSVSGAKVAARAPRALGAAQNQ